MQSREVYSQLCHAHILLWYTQIPELILNVSVEILLLIFLLNNARYFSRCSITLQVQFFAGTRKAGVITDPILLQKLESIPRALTREVKPSKEGPVVQPETSSYIENNNKINFGRLLTDEVLAADRLLVEAAKKNYDVAGI